MTELVAALDELLAEHRRIGSPVPDCIIPGRPRDEVRSRLAVLGVEPAEDLVEYLAWQDGVASQPSRQSQGGSGELFLYPFYSSPGLDEIEQRYRIKIGVSTDAHGPEPRPRSEVPEVGYWGRTWVPIFVGTCSLAADSRGGGSSPVWGQVSHPGYGPTALLFASLTELIEDIVLRFRSDVFAWRDDWQGFDENEEMTRQLDEKRLAEAQRLDTFELY